MTVSDIQEQVHMENDKDNQSWNLSTTDAPVKIRYNFITNTQNL